MHSSRNVIDEIISIQARDLDAVIPIEPPDHPTSIFVGRGALDGLSAQTVGTVVVIGSKGSVARSGLDGVVASQRNWHVFDAVCPNPTPNVINAAAAHAHEVGADTIVGVGGGSALDAARCVALMMGNATRIDELKGCSPTDDRFRRQCRLIQIPSTAGTGSEVTPFAAIWTTAGEKSSAEHETGFADVALVDPALTDSMPVRLTASVGMDAMAHGIEAIWGRYTDPLAQRYAERALELVHQHLIPAISTPSETNRNGISLAALLAGLALARSRSAIAHALSYGLTGRFGIEHGIAVGMLCRALLPSQWQDAPQEVGVILRAFNADSTDEVSDFIARTLQAGGIETTLSGAGVPRHALTQIAEQAIASNRLSNSAGTWDVPRLVCLLQSMG